MKTSPPPPTTPGSSDFPTTPELHSVLVLNRNPNTKSKRLFRVPVDGDGSYREAPSSLAEDDPRTRRALHIAGEELPYEAESPQNKAYVAFGIMPVKPEPTSSHGDCYLINVDRLHPTNSWTVNPWNMPPQHTNSRLAGSQLLVATSDGVFKATLDPTPIDLRRNADVWRLLRNGCVVGMAHQEHGGAELIPLVNLVSFGTPSAPTSSSDKMGTLDFKWPLRSQIRVRLLRPTGLGDDSWERLKTKVVALANTWLVRQPGLSFAFVEDDGYDTLVSLQALDGAQKQGDVEVLLPLADLGTYCQRRPLGVPSMFLGKPSGLKVLIRQGEVGDAYFDSTAFEHIAIHEFGHLLGLPHLHQHPLLPPLFTESDTQLMERIKDVMGVSVDAEYVGSHLKQRWPGATASSEWLSWP